MAAGQSPGKMATYIPDRQFRFKEQGATMNMQIALKLLLASSVAACCALPANAQTVDTEITGTVSLLQGAWGSAGIGNPVTLDFQYDASATTTSITSTFYTISAPVTSASIVSGALGSGINLERDGPGTGIIADTLNLNTSTVTASVVTSADKPSRGFTGDVFGLSFITDGITTTVDVVRNAFENGRLDLRDSGQAFLSNVSVGPGNQAPEIDPASALSALTLLMGGLAVIRGKKFAKASAA
jgi:hypothetical protein